MADDDPRIHEFMKSSESCKVRVVTRDPEALSRFIERFASVLAEGGVPRMPARVFAALLSTDEGRLTAAGIAETLQISAGRRVRRRPIPGAGEPGRPRTRARLTARPLLSFSTTSGTRRSSSASSC